MASSAYRHQDKVQAVCVGDVARAWRVMGMSVARSLSIVGIGVLIFVVDLRVDSLLYGTCY